MSGGGIGRGDRGGEEGREKGMARWRCYYRELVGYSGAETPKDAVLSTGELNGIGIAHRVVFWFILFIYFILLDIQQHPYWILPLILPR